MYVNGLQITKVDLNDKILPGAKFALYRTVRDGETDVMEIDGDEYYKVADLDTSTTGIAVKEQIEQLEEGEQYYLVETQVPPGYTAIDPIPLNLVLTDVYTPKPENGIYDWTQSAALTLDVDSGVKRTNADNTKDLTHSGTANSDNEIIYYRIINNPGAELPKTGGIGTTIFYVLGSLLVITGGIFLIARRRMAR